MEYHDTNVETRDIGSFSDVSGLAVQDAVSPAERDAARIYELLAREEEAAARQPATLEDRLARLGEIQRERSLYEDIGNTRVYRLLQFAYVDALYMLSPDGALEFAECAAQRQVAIGKGRNPFLPMVKVMFGEFDYEVPEVSFEGRHGLVKWRHYRGAEKYANVFRHLYDMQVPEDEVAAYLATFEGGITAVEKADRRAHARTRRGPELDGGVTGDTPWRRAPKHIPQRPAEWDVVIEVPPFVTATEGYVLIRARIEGRELRLLEQVENDAG